MKSRMERVLEEDIIRKSKEYREYIEEHIENVHKAFDIIAIKLLEENLITKEIFENVKGRLNEHDKSKFSQEEFGPYRMYFYPINEFEKEQSKKLFDQAVDHHYKNNSHHPEYHNGNPMPEEDIVEMICDWEGMGIKFGGTAKEWYYKNKKEIDGKLHDDTIFILNNFFAVLK